MSGSSASRPARPQDSTQTEVKPPVGLDAADGEVFWSTCLEGAALALQARRVLRVELADDGVWTALGQWPSKPVEQADDAVLLHQVADSALRASPALLPATGGSGVAALAVRLDSAASAAQAPVMLVVLGSGCAPAAARVLAQVVAAAPKQRLSGRGVLLTAADADLRAKAQRVYDVLQMSVRLGGETRFLRAAFTLCNELSVRFGCEQAALGWVRSAYVRLTALSHVEKFDPKASATRDLETAMEEAAQQDTEIVWPLPDADRPLVTRAHEVYVRAQGVGTMLSIPLRIDGEVVAVLSLGRREGGFDPVVLWELRLIGEACARRLAELQRVDRWVGSRALAALVRWRDQLLGPSYTAWKLAGLGVAVAIVGVALLPWPYRIDAPLSLRSKDVLFVPAPFDGYLSSVRVEVGDRVEAGRILLELDTRELVLEESMAVADELRYRSEVEKAQGSRQLADMQISRARQQQAASKLELIRHQLANAQIKAPFPSIVVEGELKKNLGAPVRKGDLLVKLAQTDDTYIELEIDQADVHEIGPGARGEFAFVGRPDRKYPLVVERIDPQATQREGRNVYLVRCTIGAAYESWWRPGMGGSARIAVDQRSLLWVMTHRTVRFLRQVFWI